MSHAEREVLWAEACDLTSPDEHAAVAGHLSGCPSCQDQFARFSAERQILEDAARSRPRQGLAPWMLTAAALLFFAGTGLVIVCSGNAPSIHPKSTGSEAPQDRGPVPPPAAGATLSLIGQFEAYRTIDLYAKVQAYVERVNADVGSHVKAGQILAQLEAPELAAQCAEARAQFAQDDVAYRRLKSIERIDRNAVTQEDLANAQAKAEISSARLKVCEANLAYLRIAAPFDGIVVHREANPGSLAGPPSSEAFKPLFRLQDSSRLRLVVHIIASDIHVVVMNPGQAVRFRVDAVPGQSFTGTIGRTSNTVDPATGTMAVDLEVDNAAGNLLPGMSAWVEWPKKR